MVRPRGTGTPTALKLLKGEVNKHRINRDEPQPDDGVPECPTKDKAVREVWDYTVAQLTRMRTITMADRDALHAYCEQVIQYREAAELLHIEGPYLETGTGLKRHPASMIMREAAALIKMYAGQFGLTPSARSAIRVADQQPKSTEAGPSRLLSS